MYILPLGYLPSIEWFKLALSGDAIIDLGENYIKRSERNRAQIMTAQGVLELSVPVKNGNRPRTPMREVEIDHTKKWGVQQWRAIQAAYRNSPYLEHFEHLLEPHFVGTPEPLLWRHNLNVIETVMKIMGAKEQLNISEHYVIADAADIDLRPKHRAAFGSDFAAAVAADFGAAAVELVGGDMASAGLVGGDMPTSESRFVGVNLPTYTQVFSDRQPFAANLSILDLLLCEGLASRSHLLR